MEGELAIGFWTVIIGLVFWGSRFNKKRKKKWAEVAQSLGLKFIDDRIVGRIDGFQIYVGTLTHGIGNARETITTFSAGIHKSLPEALSIEPEGLAEKTSKLFGSKDVQLERPNLDPKLMVKARNGDEVRAWASRQDVAAGLERLATFKRFRLQRDTLRIEISGPVADPAQLRMQIQDLVSIATLISSGCVDKPEAESDDDVLW